MMNQLLYHYQDNSKFKKGYYLSGIPYSEETF